MDKQFYNKTLSGYQDLDANNLIVDTIESNESSLTILNDVSINGDIISSGCSSLNTLSLNVSTNTEDIETINNNIQNLTTEIEEYPEELKNLTSETIENLELIDQDLSTVSNPSFSGITCAGSSSRLFSLRIAPSGSVSSGLLEVENPYNVNLIHLYNTLYDTKQLIKRSSGNAGILRFTDGTTNYDIKMDENNDLYIHDEIKINNNGIYLPNISPSNYLYLDTNGLLTTQEIIIPSQIFQVNEDDDVYYDDGKVLVGYDTSQNTANFQVNGIIYASSNIVSEAIVGGDSAQFDKTLQVPRIYLKNIETSGVITADIYGDDDYVHINLSKPLIIDNQEVFIDNITNIKTYSSWTSNGWRCALSLDSDTTNCAVSFSGTSGLYGGLGFTGSNFYFFTTTIPAGDTSNSANYIMGLSNSSIFPVTNNSLNFGDTTHYFNNGYINTIYTADIYAGVMRIGNTNEINTTSGHLYLQYSLNGNVNMCYGGGDVDVNLRHIYNCRGVGFGWTNYIHSLTYHSIGCHPSDTDSLIINSYNNVYIKLDTDNNDATSSFKILDYSNNELFEVEDTYGSLTGGKKVDYSVLTWGDTSDLFARLFRYHLYFGKGGSSDCSSTLSRSSLYISHTNTSDTSSNPLIQLSNYMSNTSYSLGIYFHTGCLPGYSNNIYPVIKCSYTYLYFAVYGNYCAYLSSTNVGGLDFTGQHRASTDETIKQDNIQDYVGLIVISTGKIKSLINGEIKEGKDAITINEAIPVVSLSNIEHDKRVFGVISCGEDTNNANDEQGNIREYKTGALTSIIHKPIDDKRIYINSVGEGALWVNNLNGNIENGDYITSSNISGLGMKQDDDFLHNYTVAKSTMNCDFNLDDPTYECDDCITYRKAFISCTYHCG